MQNQLDNSTYNNYQNMVFLKTNKFYKKYKYIEKDELIAQANLIFCESYYSFSNDSKNISFSTFLWKQLDWGLFSYVKNKNNRIKKEISLPAVLLNNYNYYDKNQEAILFADFIKNISKKAKQILKLICYPSTKEVKEINKINKKQITIYRFNSL